MTAIFYTEEGEKKLLLLKTTRMTERACGPIVCLCSGFDTARTPRHKDSRTREKSSLGLDVIFATFRLVLTSTFRTFTWTLVDRVSHSHTQDGDSRYSQTTQLFIILYSFLSLSFS